MDSDDLKQMMHKVEKIIQCPVCLGCAKPPVVQCFNGHISCRRCSITQRVPVCSVCRGSFIDTVNRVVEELLEVLPRECPYTDKGCTLTACFDSHIQVCLYRPITCTIGVDEACSWFGTVKDWQEHVSERHTYSATYNFHASKTLWFNHFFGYWHTQVFCLKVEDEVFLFHVRKTPIGFYQTVRHIVFKKLQKIYFFRVTFKRGEDTVYQSLIEAAPFMDKESVESNPVVVLLNDLKECCVKRNNQTDLPVIIEALAINLPDNI